MTVTELPIGARPDADGQLMIAVVSDSPLARTGLTQFLALDPTVTLESTVDSMGALRQSGVRPHIVIIDLHARHAGEPGVPPWSLLPPGSAAIVLCRPEEPLELRAALHGGVRAFLTRDADAPELLNAVQTVRAGGLHVTAELVETLMGQALAGAPGGRQSLASREVETLQWVAEGLTHGQISRRMGLTEATVSTYVKRIRTKLNAGNKAELTRRAIELGYLRPHGLR